MGTAILRCRSAHVHGRANDVCCPSSACGRDGCSATNHVRTAILHCCSTDVHGATSHIRAAILRCRGADVHGGTSPLRTTIVRCRGAHVRTDPERAVDGDISHHNASRGGGSCSTNRGRSSVGGSCSTSGSTGQVAQEEEIQEEK